MIRLHGNDCKVSGIPVIRSPGPSPIDKVAAYDSPIGAPFSISSVGFVLDDSSLFPSSVTVVARCSVSTVGLTPRNKAEARDGGNTAYTLIGGASCRVSLSGVVFG
jgi:hypothetical protein